MLVREKFSRGVEFQSRENVKTQILCYENYIENYSFHQEHKGNGATEVFTKKLTSAWKQTSQRFHLVLNSHQGRSFHSPKKAGERKVSLWLESLLKTSFLRWKYEHLLLAEKREESFYLIIQSMFYKKLLLFFSYAWRIMFVFRCEIFHEREFFFLSHLSCSSRRIRSKHYEIFTESYKLHRKLLHRIEY